MDKSINNTILKYLELIKKNFPDIDSAYVFGSYVSGKSTKESDIDLALIFKNLDESKRFDTQVQLMMLAAQIDTRIEPHPISFEDFLSGNPFVAEIKKTGVKIVA
jgi:predicted nucleotidyltransferase